MTLRPLELDYRRGPDGAQRSRYALLAVSILVAGLTAWHYLRLGEELERKESILAQADAPVDRAARATAAEPADREEYVLARKIYGRLAMPWGELFEALEQAKTAHVALLSVQPDAERHVVMIVGEARDYLALLSYIASISSQRAFHRVHLVRHETPPGPGEAPIAFTVSAAWEDPL